LRGGTFSQQVLMLTYSISGFPGRPTQTELDKLSEFSQQVDRRVTQLNQFVQKDYADFNQLLKESGYKPLREMKIIAIK
ncbi:MAG: hypothetical protein DRI99_00895, partial [Candidatus Aminicenantes bacterium]